MTTIWERKFGDDYQVRNTSIIAEVTNRIKLWEKIGKNLHSVKSVYEIGCGMGANLHAIRWLNPNLSIYGCEPNKFGYEYLKNNKFIVDNSNYLDVTPIMHADIVFTYGMLIHTHKDDLYNTMEKMYIQSNRYIVMCEYFRPKREMLMYRDMPNQMWGDEYGKVFLDYFRVKPLDCGFMWKETTGLDNITYWVFEKE